MSTNFVNLAGLIYDIAGAYLLGRAVVFNKREKIAQQIATAWNYNKHLIPCVVEGRVDAVFGLGLMITGFVLQAASIFWNGWLWELAVAVAVLAVVLIAYKVMLPKLVERGTESVVAFIEAKHKKVS